MTKNLKAENAILRRALDIASKSRVKIYCHDYLMSNHPSKCVYSPKKCQEYIKSEFFKTSQGGK